MTMTIVVATFAVIFIGFLYSLYFSSKNKKTGFTIPLPIELLSKDDEGRKQQLVYSYYRPMMMPGSIMVGLCLFFSVMLYYDISSIGLRLENISLIIVNSMYGLIGIVMFLNLFKKLKEERLRPATAEFLRELRERSLYSFSKFISAWALSLTTTALLLWLFIFSGYLNLH